jgi:ELWxxDGT repeat protein
MQPNTCSGAKSKFRSIVLWVLRKGKHLFCAPLGNGLAMFCLCMFAASFTAGGQPQPHEFVRLLKDFNLDPTSAFPGSFLVSNGKLFFSATDGYHGTELWQTDGTNVSRLTDISYGTAPSAVSQLAEYAGEVYFRAFLNQGASGSELWKYNGSNASLVADVNPSGSSLPANLTVFNGVLYFAASDGTTGTELWAYNGVNAYQVADLNTGPASSNPSGLTVYNGLLCFAASNNVSGTEFYTYDGSTIGVANINAGAANSNPSGFKEFNGILYFQATEPTGGAELWAFDGINVFRAADIRSGTVGSSPANFCVYSNKLYFAANDGTNGTELWAFDDVNSPARITQIGAGSLGSSPANLAVFNGALYFSAADSLTGTELWRYDGVTAARMADISPNSGSSSPAGLTVYNGYLYFAATDVATSRQVWRTDGTNVALFARINYGSTGTGFGPGAVFNGNYYFMAYGTNQAFYKYDGTNFSVVSTTRFPSFGGGCAVYKNALYYSTDTQIWRYDGTNFTSVGGQCDPFLELVEFNGVLYFNGEDLSKGQELWKCDGTNVSRVTDIYTNAGDADPQSLTVFQGRLYFYATDATGRGLWRFDGTNATRVGAITITNLGAIIQYGGRLLFGASTNSDFEPWSFDGTNLAKLAQINIYGTNGNPIFWTTFRNRAWFSANDGVHKPGELWSTDGTNVTRITDGLNVAYAFSYADTLYFAADDDIHGYELWKYDGANVSLVADINQGPSISQPIPHQAFKGMYLFEATDGANGIELWRLDAVSQLVQITGLRRQGNDMSISWTSPGGLTNVLQTSAGNVGGGVTNNFADRSTPLVAPAGDMVLLTYLDVGGATNTAARYYRVRIP